MKELDIEGFMLEIKFLEHLKVPIISFHVI